MSRDQKTPLGPARDPWECDGFRIVPCMNANSVWVEIETPMTDQGEPLPVEMSPERTRQLALFLIRVADTADAWRRGRG